MRQGRAARKPAVPAKKPMRRMASDDRRVVHLTAEHVLQRAAKRFLADTTPRCAKCSSTFVFREPAFLHCHYCGKMARIANASLMDQEVFELRSGLRVAS